MMKCECDAYLGVTLFNRSHSVGALASNRKNTEVK